MKIKIFTKKTCPKCPPAKELATKLKEKGIEVELYDMDEVEGLAESAMFNVMATPTVVIVEEDGKEKKSFRGQVPTLEEILGEF